MIGKTTLSNSFEATLRYVYTKESATVLAASVAQYQDHLQVAKAMSQVAGDRSEKPCYHISLSPAQGDRLQQRDWYRLSQDFLNALGTVTHQYVAVLHTDATYPDGQQRPHLHFVINRYEMGSCLDHALCLHFPKIERTIRKLEQDYQLEPTPCSWEARRRSTLDLSEQEQKKAEENETASPVLNQPQVTPPEPLPQKKRTKKQKQRTRDHELTL